jgi:hypothetical protein
MRKLSITLATILMVGTLAWKADAATATATAIPNAARNFSPIHETACRGYGRFCGPGSTRVCGNHHCWCRPC